MKPDRTCRRSIAASKGAKEAESHCSHLGWKETQSELAIPGAGSPNRHGAVKVADRFTNHRDHIGRVATRPHDEGRSGAAFLRDWKEYRRFRIFAEREVLPIRHEAHDLDLRTGPVLKITPHGLLRMEKPPREFPIHNRHSRALGSVRNAYVASGKQRRSSGPQISR